MWGKRHPVEHPDVEEARRMREAAAKELEQIRAQDAEVTELARRLQLRRIRNHFGEDIQVTFRPRGSHA